jgi:flagellum-specific peptidoglycan hydrolase FlgJ
VALTKAEAALVKSALPKAARDRTPAMKQAMAKWRAEGRPTAHGIRYSGKIKPFGDYDSYVKVLARRTNLKPEQVRRIATGVDPETFQRLFAASKDKLTAAEKRYAKQVRQGFIQAGRLSGYDPRFIAAFGAQESAWGQATPSNAPFNFWGWSVYTGRSSSAISNPFQNPKAAFRYYGQKLGENYGGARSVYDPVWSPYAADPQHEAKIANILKTYFGGNPMDIRFRT